MEALLKKLESLVGTDDFDYESEEIMEQLEEAGAGQEIIADLLGIMERHPLDDFGMPVLKDPDVRDTNFWGFGEGSYEAPRASLSASGLLLFRLFPHQLQVDRHLGFVKEQVVVGMVREIDHFRILRQFFCFFFCDLIIVFRFFVFSGICQAGGKDRQTVHVRHVILPVICCIQQDQILLRRKFQRTCRFLISAGPV